MAALRIVRTINQLDRVSMERIRNGDDPNESQRSRIAVHHRVRGNVMFAQNGLRHVDGRCYQNSQHRNHHRHN